MAEQFFNNLSQVPLIRQPSFIAFDTFLPRGVGKADLKIPSRSFASCYFVSGTGAKYCDEYVCLFVCLSVCLCARITRVHYFTVRVTYRDMDDLCDANAGP